MKTLISNYSFNKTAKTITFTDYVSITLENVLLVTNVTDGITIYLFNEPTLGGTVATNVLTLEYDTSAMDNADDLQIWYDDPNATQSVSATNLDIRDLSQTSDAVAIYGSDDGGTTKRIIKTDAGGAMQVDLEVANVTVTSSALPTGAATEATLTTRLSESDFDTKVGSLTETAPSTDTASSGLNGRLQRIAQRLTSLITAIGSPFQAGGSIGNTSFGATQSGTWNINNVSGTVSLPTGAATLAEQQTQTASLSVLDDWDESDRAKVNPIAGQAGVAGGSGVVGATTQRVVLATDVALPAGTNNIGDVDVLTLPALPTGTNTIGSVKITDGTDTADVIDSGTFAGIGAYILDGSGNPITTFGGGTQYTEDDASVANPTGTQVIARRRDTLSSETTADGDVTAVNSTAKGELYVKHVDSVSVAGDVANDSADSGNPVKIGYKAKNYGSLPTAVTDGDRVNGLSDRYGAHFVQNGSPYVQPASGEYSANQTNTALVSSVSAGTAVRLYGFCLNIDYNAQAPITFSIGFGATTLDTVVWKANNIVPSNNTIMIPVVAGASGEELRVTFSGYTNGFVNVIAYYDLISI